jgi:hypothetical protein
MTVCAIEPSTNTIGTDVWGVLATLFWFPSWFIDLDHNGTTLHDSNNIIEFKNKFWSRVGSGAGQWDRQWRLQWALHPWTVMPLMLPRCSYLKWRRLDRRDRVTVPRWTVMPLMLPRWSYLSGGDPITAIGSPYPVTPLYPSCRFQPKYILESPKSPISQIPIIQSFQSRFRILSMHTMDLCLSYSTQFDSRFRRLRAISYQIVCTPGSPPLTHLVSAIPNFGTIILRLWYYSKRSPELSYAGWHQLCQWG